MAAAGFSQIGGAYYLSPETQYFVPSATATWAYSASALAFRGIDAARLKIFTYDRAAQSLVPLQTISNSSGILTSSVSLYDAYFVAFAPSSPSGAAGSGLGIGIDLGGLLWSVSSSSNAVVLSHDDANGVLLASTTLSRGDPSLPWSVFIDQSGAAYAVGATVGGNGADRVGVYRASRAGDAVVSTIAYDSGFRNNNFPFSISPSGWIAGGVETQGPIDLTQPGAPRFSLALWKLSTSQGLIGLTTTYTRAGFDVATGIAEDPAGNLWVAGFSRSPSPRSPRSFDLALWKYAADGRTLLAGPYIREGYLTKYDTSLLARVTISSGGVYVLAPRGNSEGTTDMALTVFDAAGGRVLSESAWRPGDGSSAFPSAVLWDAAGRLTVAGGFESPDGTVSGVWRYGAGGSLISATQANSGGARGAVFNGSSLWFTVDGSTSLYLVASETPMTGGFADIQPPRTMIAESTYVVVNNAVFLGSKNNLGFVFVDDKFAVGDGLGVGTRQTLYAVDGSSFSLFTSSFSLAEGAHTISFYSVDLEGNAEIVRSTNVAVDLTPPTAILVSTSPGLYAIQAQDPISNGVASGVRLIRYLVDVAPQSCGNAPPSPTAPSGTCANYRYAGPFSLSTGTHAVYYQAVDAVGNQGVIGSSVVVNGVVGPSKPTVAISAVSPISGYAGALVDVTAIGAGFAPGAALELLRVNVATGTWSTLPAMTRARKQGSLSKFTDGTVVAAGGFDALGNPLAASELYDPNLRMWIPLPSLSQGRAKHVAVALNDGRLLAAGGSGAGGAILSSAEIYSPGTGQWSPTASMSNARVGARAIKLLDGRVLVAGGGTSSPVAAAEIFDPVAGTWSPTGSLNAGRYNPTLTLLPSGKVLIAGGTDGSAALSSAEIYDPATNAWTLTGSMLAARHDAAAVVLGDGKVLVVGGAQSSALSSAEFYSPGAGSWSAGPALNSARVFHVALLAGQGQPLVIGGENSGGELSSVEFYDGNSGAWQTAPSLPAAQDYARVVALDDGSLLGAGGQSGGSATSNAALYQLPVSTAIIAVSDTFQDQGRLVGRFDLTNAATGAFAAAVVDADQRRGFLPAAFQVLADTIAPVTTLLIDGKVVSASSLTIAPTDTIGFAASDVGSGVAQIFYALDASSRTRPSVFASAFSVSAGTHALQYASVDRAGNLEAIHAVSLTVLGTTDVLPPRTSLVTGAASYGSAPGYVSTATPLGFIAVDDKLTVGDGAGVGVARTLYAVDSGSFAVYAGSFTLAAEGPHTISFYSADLAGNIEALRVSSVAVDATPPATSVAVGASSFSSAAGVLYVTPATPVTLSAVDPAPPQLSSGPAASGSGVARTLVSVDGGPFTVYASSLAFAEGAHTLAYYSVDNVGNAEAPRVLALQSDATPPQTALAVSSPAYNGYVSSAAVFALSAVDPIVNGAASGVAATRYQINGGVFVSSPLAFSLSGPDGAYVLRYRSVDDAGNAEVLRSTAVLLDQTPPQTSLTLLGGHQFVGPDNLTFYASADTRFALLAADPLVNGAASGVAWTKYQDGTGAFLTYVSTFALAEGAHRLAYQSQDNVGNLEVLRSTTALIDATPPVTTLSIGSPTYTAPDGTVYVTPASSVTFAAVDPALPTGQPGSGLARIEVAVDSAAFAVYTASLTFAEGRHTVLYRAVDNVGNVEATRTLALQSDATPPITALTISTPSFNGFVSAATLFSLSAVDPVSSGVASGAAFTRYRINGGAFATSPLAFRLNGPDGAYQVDYQSQDNVGNLEVLRSTAVFLDQTPPVTTPHLGAPNYVAVDGTQYVTPAAPVMFTAVDPSSGAAASGVNRIEVALDGGAFTVYATTLAFAEGRHTILYRAIDNVGNVEAAKTLSLQSDATPPVTAFKASGTYYTASAPEGPRLYAPLGFAYSLPAVDPVVNGVASGLAFTRYRAGQLTSYASGSPAYAPGAFANYASTFTLAEGIRRVDFQSQDNVTNLELLKSATVFVDATPPATTLAIGAPQYAAGGTLYVSTATPFTLASQDPVVQEVASGVSGIFFRLDANAFAPYSSTFTIPVPDGFHSASFYAADNVGNLEAVKISTVALDATPPQTSLLVVVGRQFPGPGVVTFYASADTRFALPAVDPIVNGVAAGVAWTRWQDNSGAFTAYVSTFALAEGAHALGYQSQDNVANLEVLHSTNAWIDATPPITTFAFGAPYYQAPDGTNYVTPATPISFSAVDPNLPTGQPGSGVNRIEVAIDGGAFAVYTTSLTFAEGRHTILYRSIDNVANVEATKTLDVQSDATPPITELAILGGHQFPGPDSVSFYASADARYGLPAVDPVVKNVASGVAWTRWQDNGGAFQAFTSTFALAEGVHHLAYQSQDNVQNREVLRSTTALVDATAPITSLAIIGGHLFPGPDGSTFYASSDTRFALPAFDPVVSGVASGLAFTRRQDNGGAFAVSVSTFALAEGAHALGYQSQDNVANLEVLRSTNAWIDATPPVTTVAIGSPTYTSPDGTIYVTPAAPIAFTASDPNLPTGQPGSGVARIEVALDGGAFATYTAALKLPEGRHAILYRAVDNVANVEASHALAVQSDATPPVSSLVIGSPQYQLPNVLLVSSRTPFAVAAVDPLSNNVASGVKDSWYNVNDVVPSTGAVSQFLSSFTLSGLDVNKVVQFYSRDNVLNTEVIKSSMVLLDSTPPEISLLSPAACDSGICRVLKGRFPVLGTARDLHFASYILDYSPGQSATTGYALISSGTVAVSSGALGTWDASALAGWQTLRLTATDLVQNVSVLAISVFVGDPATSMLLGNHETFDMPTGVAAGADGRIYVADRDNDRIAVFTSTGGLAAVFGGQHDDRQDDDKVSTTTLRLHEPAGVAVDAAGNIYVADTGHHRVLELSPSGQVLLDLGRRKIERDDGRTKTEFASGKAPGEFRHPLGVAVDAAGSIYVADTGNSRVQVFTSTGGFALQFALPALPAPGDDDHEAGEKDDDARALGRPAGIAVDAAGDIYLADLTGRRALRYDPSGRLTLTIPILGDKPNQPGRPYGVAISTSGDCLLVSDMQFAHVLKFDMNGVQNLIFGARARDDDKRKAPGIALRKPAGLALDAAGNLYVADRNAEKIEKFGLPTGQPTLVVPPPGPGDDGTARDVVSREDGGKVERKDKAAVNIPAQALSDDLKVSVRAPAADVAAAGAKTAADANLKTASPPVDFGPEGTKFSAPVTLTLPYSPDLLAQQNGDETSLKVHYWNKDKGQWEELATQVDEQDRTVTAKTTHFSLYQVFATSASAAKPLATADPTFTFHDGYAFPNPVRGASAVTLRIQPGLADSVEVHVYDISGRKVHSSSDFAQNILDDGNGKGNQYTYDHVWNVSGVGSGVYMYVITAKKAGMSAIHKSGKIGVVK